MDAAEHGARRVEGRHPAAERSELLAAARGISRLVEDAITAYGDLVGTDHDRL